MAAMLTVAFLLVVAPAAFGATIWQPTQIPGPTGAIGADFGGVSCPAAGSCVAVGEWMNSEGHSLPMAAAETSGTWGQTVAIALPTGAVEGELNGVSCPTAGSCVAVGTWVDSENHSSPMGAAETDGTWGQAVAISLPTDTTGGELEGVSCPAADSCVAVGTSVNSEYDSLPIVATETGGTWNQPVAIGSEALLHGVSCPAAGSCVAVGRTFLPLVATETDGTWGQPVTLTPPEATVAFLEGVSCPATGSCVAVGTWVNSESHWLPVGATETDGTWGQAVAIAPPAGAHESILEGVGCPIAGSCVAVGWERSEGYTRPMVVTEADGTWNQAVTLAQPAGALTAFLNGVSCPAAGSCVAVGSDGNALAYGEEAVSESTPESPAPGGGEPSPPAGGEPTTPSPSGGTTIPAPAGSETTDHGGQAGGRSQSVSRCLRKAKTVYRKARKGARHKHGRARAKALRKAHKQKTKRVSRCRNHRITTNAERKGGSSND